MKDKSKDESGREERYSIVPNLFDTGVRPAIDDFLKTESEKLRDYGDYWSASSAGYCMRKNIFERLKVPYVQEDARKQRVFSSGHIFHEWIQRITKNAGLSVAQELELQDEKFMIRGHIDDLILIPGGHSEPPYPGMSDSTWPSHLILYDYKTAHSRSFHYAKGRPMSHYHRHQLGTYMWLLRGGNVVDLKQHQALQPKDTENLSEARRLAISKDDLCMDEQQLLWSKELEKDITDYWTELNKWWESKKLPPCTCGDYEINSKTGKGFMADPRYNPYFYEGEPCSIKWYLKWKDDNAVQDNKSK